MRKCGASLILVSVMFVSCSETVGAPSRNEVTEHESEYTVVEPTSIETIEAEDDNTHINIANDHYYGEYGSVTINIPLNDNYPSTARILRIIGEYPEDLSTGLENSSIINNIYSVKGEYSWSLMYDVIDIDGEYNSNLETLFSPSALANSYQNNQDNNSISFDEFVINNRLNSIQFINLNAETYDLIDELNLDCELYGSLIECNYHSPSGEESKKFNILQQIDGISIFDTSLFPRGANLNDSPGLFFVEWGDYIGVAGDTGSVIGSLCISFVNNEGDTCGIDLHDYEIIDVVEDDLEIKPFENCLQIWINRLVSSSNEGSLVGAINTDTWIYQADLVYIPVHLIDAVTEAWTDEYYLFPCWVMLYTQIDYTFEYPVEIDGVIGLNAVTGENIDINDLEYQRYWG